MSHSQRCRLWWRMTESLGEMSSGQAAKVGQVLVGNGLGTGRFVGTLEDAAASEHDAFDPRQKVCTQSDVCLTVNREFVALTDDRRLRNRLPAIDQDHRSEWFILPIELVDV